MGNHKKTYFLFQDASIGSDFIDNGIKIDLKIMDKVKQIQRKKNGVNYIYERKRIQYSDKDFIHDYLIIHDIIDSKYMLIKNDIKLNLKFKTNIHYTENKRNQIYKNLIFQTDDIVKLVKYLKKYLKFNLLRFLK